jgi:hypothetical protein
MRADNGRRINPQELQRFDRLGVVALVLISSLYIVLVTLVEFGQDLGGFWP